MCLKCLISSLFSRMCRRAVCHFIKKERNKCTRGKGKKTQHTPRTQNTQKTAANIPTDSDRLDYRGTFG